MEKIYEHVLFLSHCNTVITIAIWRKRLHRKSRCLQALISLPLCRSAENVRFVRMRNCASRLRIQIVWLQLVDRMHAFRIRHIDVCELIRFRRWCAQYARHFVNLKAFPGLLDQSKRHEEPIDTIEAGNIFLWKSVKSIFITRAERSKKMESWN